MHLGVRVPEEAGSRCVCTACVRRVCGVRTWGEACVTRRSVKRKLKPARRPEPTAPATLGSVKNTLTRKEKVQIEATKRRKIAHTSVVSLSANSPV